MALSLPSYPATLVHHTRPVSLAAAHAGIERYLARTSTQPHLHPDAQLTPAGVTFSASSGPAGNLTISSLRRVARGLGGEDLAVTAEELDELRATLGTGAGAADRSAADRIASGDGLREIGSSRDRGLIGPDGSIRRGVLKKRGSGMEGADADEERRQREELNGGDDGEGWEDPVRYAENQEVLDGDVGDREGAPVVRQGEEIADPMGLESARTLERETSPSGDKRKLTEAERDDRRAAKKQRRKEELRKQNRQAMAAAGAA